MATHGGREPVDFGIYAVGKEPPGKDQLKALGTDILQQMEEHMHLHMVNTGVDRQQVDSVWEASRDFFALPKEKKEEYGFSPYQETGLPIPIYVGIGKGKEKPGVLEHKEALNFFPLQTMVFPEKEVPGIIKKFLKLWNDSAELCVRILECLALALDQDPKVFTQYYQGLISRTTGQGQGQLRSNYFYPITDDIDEGGDTIRFAEHRDIGLITLDWQDEGGTLQMRNKSGTKWVDVDPIPGTTLVHSGMLLQVLTSDRIRAVPHRVIAPRDPEVRRKPRRSAIYFFYPDSEVSVSPIDGSDKYKPMNLWTAANIGVPGYYLEGAAKRPGVL